MATALKAYIDFGNKLIKYLIPNASIEASTHSAVKQLTQAEWKTAGRTGIQPKGYIKVQGIPYVVGDMALRHGIPDRPRGASRYTETYFGVGMCFALASALQRSIKSVVIYTSYAPRDVQYIPNIKAAATGRWDVEYQGETFSFSVSDVMTLDEPLGGFNNFVLTDKGMPRKDNPIKEATVGVMDIGGYTTDTFAVDPNGEIDNTTFASQITGISNVMETFEEALRANNRIVFQKAGDIHPNRLQSAFVKGVFTGGGHTVSCKAEADEAASLLLNDIDTIFEKMGGLVNYDGFVLTGGGSQLMLSRLHVQYPNIPFYVSEPETDKAHLSNVRGMRKVFTMIDRLEKMGVL